jgi:CelD/BcsL family acetyltransferase involved in cellulose biosynthesis
MLTELKIVLIDDFPSFLSLKEEWTEILNRCDHSVFSTWEWLSTWWKHFGKAKRLLVLLVEEDNKIIGIAPLMYSVHKMLGLRQGKIEFMGTPDSDYNDFILTKKSEECLKLFIDYLHGLSENWKCVDLTDIPEKSKSLLFLNRISKSLKPSYQCPYTSLPKSYDIFLKSLSQNLRYDLHRSLRRLEKDGYKANFADYSDSQSFDEGMRMFFELHQKRWTSRGFSGVFAEEKYRNFHLDIAESFCQKGWLSLYSLELSGKSVSALYGFKYHSKYFSYLSGLDPAFYRYSVGNLLIAHAMSQFILLGLDEFDFMRGAEEYKDRWNTVTRWNSQAILTRKGFLANVEHRLYNEYWHQGNRLKYLLKMEQ